MTAWWVLALCATVSAQMDQLPKKPKSAPINADLPYIRCQVCETMVAQALEQAKQAGVAAKPGQQQKRRFESSNSMGELESQMEDVVSNVCNAESKEGKWLSSYDVVKRGSALRLENQVHGDVVGGVCRRECRTIEKACVGILEAVDDMPELLVEAAKAGTSSGMLGQRVCKKLTGVCKKGKTPVWPEGKVRRNEEFKAKTKKDADTEELMATLKGMPGMGGGGLTMMSGDDLDLGNDAGDGLKDET